MMEILNALWGLVTTLFFYILGKRSSGKDKEDIIKVLRDTRKSGLHESIIQRIQGLEGYWEGTVNQQDGPDGVPIEFPIDVTFDVISWQDIRGEFRYSYKGVKTVLEAIGEAIDNRIINLQFIDINKSVIRFGTFMLDFGHLGESLDGHFVAYAAERKAIVTGRVTLYRVYRNYDG
jgi:hypothetical protein